MKVSSSLLMRILTHNIRYATTSPFKGEELWSVRKQYVLNELQFQSRFRPETFICLQEALHNQMEDLMTGLNAGGDEWAYIGVGRNDGKKAGEYSPIIYRPAVWELQDWETVWLSETPDVPSKGWDAASIRIVTIGVFKHRDSRKQVLAMSTHLDDQGSKSREEAAKIILKKIDEYTAPGNLTGVFLGGDFNSEENQEAYQEITKSGSSVIDARNQVDAKHRYGNELTYTSFGYEGYPSTRIDYIFVGPRSGLSLPWTVKGYGVLPNKFDDGVISSDHRAVIVDAELS